jgi:hypothetical protein
VPPRSSPKKSELASAPSMLKSLWMPRAPFRETRSPNASLAPGVSRMRSLKSRPRIGRFSICSRVTEVVRPGSVVSTTGASAVTVISSDSSGRMEKRTLVAVPRRTVTSSRVSVRKPESSAVTR